MTPPDTLTLRLEAVAIAARLRRHGEPDVADLVERWADGADLATQLEPIN
ncbi:MAG: hypothetical protein WD990_00675 [Acidimicrobiia bacterium]